MPNYAQITDGIATNVIVADSAFAESIGAVLVPDGFGIGDLYDGTSWTKTDTGELADIAAMSDAIPFPKVTSRQLWLAAYRTMALKEDDVIAMTATMEDQEAAEELRIEIRKAQTYERDHPAMDDLAALVGLPIEQFNSLWCWAATL